MSARKPRNTSAESQGNNHKTANRLDGGIDRGNRNLRNLAPVKLVVPQVTLSVIAVQIQGISPLIIRAWDQKTAQQLADKAMGKKSAKGREAVKPDEVFKGARYISKEGWDGIPVGAFKAALVDAVSCLDLPRADFNMTLAKKTFFIAADGICRVSGRDLVRIHGKAERFDLMQPTSGGGPYMSYRPIYREWSCKLRIQFNPAKIDAQGVLNLLAAAGYFCGVGEHRPSAKESRTGVSGRFEVVADK